MSLFVYGRSLAGDARRRGLGRRSKKQQQRVRTKKLIGLMGTMFDEPTAANESSAEASPWTHVQFDTSIVSTV
jgi:hypothetical protein